MSSCDSRCDRVGCDRCEYRVQRLRDVVGTRAGILHDGGASLLPWGRVAFAFAATVGEPDGISTIVFDLLLERRERQLVVGRFDADPWGDAIPLAGSVLGGLGPDRTAASLRALASDGSPLAWYPDLEAFEAAARERFEKA